MRITFLGNFRVDFTSETHHVKSLEALGHEVITLQESGATGEEILHNARQSDLLVVVHTHNWPTPGMPLAQVIQTLKAEGIPTITYHLDLWLGIQRQKDLETDEFYKHLTYFFTVDKLMADWFNENTEVKGVYLPAGVFHEEVGLADAAHSGPEIVFTGSYEYHPEYPYRRVMLDFLRLTYPGRFRRYGYPAADFPGATIRRGPELNLLYATSKIVVGDTLNIGFNYPYYSSDRLFEVPGRGGFLIYPRIKGLSKFFADGVEVVYYTPGNLAELKTLIDYYLEHDEEREAIRLAGHERAKAEHTYKHRWDTILKTIKRGSHVTTNA